MFVPCTALLYDSTAATRTLTLSTTLLSISCGIRLISLLMMPSYFCGLFSKLCLSGTVSENNQSGWDLGNRMAEGYRFDAKWVCPMRSYAWSIQAFCSRNEAPLHFLNRGLEYLRHNFPSDRLLSHQTNNSWSSYSQDLNWTDYFLRGYQKDRVCENNPQTREDIIRKWDGFHRKCSMELWTILMFELLLCCHTAARCMERR